MVSSTRNIPVPGGLSVVVLDNQDFFNHRTILIRMVTIVCGLVYTIQAKRLEIFGLEIGLESYFMVTQFPQK